MMGVANAPVSYGVFEMTADGPLPEPDEVLSAVREAGYDGVEVMGSEGYLVNQFLAPRTNRRTDAWGGTPEKRRRFAVETVRAVREATGTDFILIYRISVLDLVEDISGRVDVEGDLADLAGDHPAQMIELVYREMRCPHADRPQRPFAVVERLPGPDEIRDAECHLARRRPVVCGRCDGRCGPVRRF